MQCAHLLVRLCNFSNLGMQLFSQLPEDAQLACLARVPWVDLRHGVAATCKEWNKLVDSKAFHKTRAAAGCVEWAVFGNRISGERNNEDCFLVTASSAHRTRPRPVDPPKWALETFTLGDEVVLIPMDEICPSGKLTNYAHAFNPRWNTWRQLAPLIRADGRMTTDAATWTTSQHAGGRIFVVGGSRAGAGGLDSSFRVDVYDPAQDAWSQLPDRPTNEGWAAHAEVAGKVYFFGAQEDLTVFDLATQTWATGPRLPFVPDEHEIYSHTTAFERNGRLVVMARFCFGSSVDSIRYAAFVYDPSTETWSEAPFPAAPLQAYRCSDIDGTLFAYGSEWPNVRDLHDPNRRFGDENTRVVMLRPGSKTWVDLPLPAGAKCVGTRIAAVRVG